MSDENPTAAFPEAPAASGGETWIADAIVAKVAATAAREVDGVEDLRGGGVRRGWVRASERRRGGASVRIDAGTATIALRLVVRDGVAIPGVVESVRARVVERVEFATGMTVARVDIGVVDVVPPPAEDAPAEASPAAAGTAHAGPDPSAAVPAGA
ncbi:Asp23/Gls24 family envelope stress response protein [Miltoncostaea oceani]|jgi:uncharacterized alkaline shock family protein YloU|uniref:Asp23/Gls24 family envelope stress response protein n=1 Tax=Miltoncostaea oceani TaxID=2843216 RepID=UPI001C3D9DCA|nr:Asp23/Gls24 family envelope stress response protein [Miltoncostaea oceani]